MNLNYMFWDIEDFGSISLTESVSKISLNL